MNIDIFNVRAGAVIPEVAELSQTATELHLRAGASCADTLLGRRSIPLDETTLPDGSPTVLL